MSSHEFLTQASRDTWLTRMDPRTKFVMAFVFIVLSVMYVDPLILGLILAASLPFWILGGLSLRGLVKPLLGILLFLAILFLGTQIFFAFGTQDDASVLLSWGPITIYEEGLRVGVVQFFRVGIPMSIALVLFLSTDPTMLARALMKLRAPFEIAFIMLAAIRFFPIFVVEASNISQAQRVRGVNTQGFGGLIRRLRLLAFPLMIAVLRKARTVGLSVETKGFGARRWNDFYKDVKYGPLDYVITTLAVLTLIAAIYLRFVLGIGASDFRMT